MPGEGGRDEDGGTAEGVSESVAGVQEGRSHLTRDCLEAVKATFDLGRSHQNLCSQGCQPFGTKKCPIFSEKMPQMGFLLHKDI